MNKLVSNIEKLKPFFEKVSRNRYLRAIRDGFISAMPIVLFSSIFMLLAYVPNIFGFYWSKEIEAMILKPYNYSMGILALVVATIYCSRWVYRVGYYLWGNVIILVCGNSRSINRGTGSFGNLLCKYSK